MQQGYSRCRRRDTLKKCWRAAVTPAHRAPERQHGRATPLIRERHFHSSWAANVGLYVAMHAMSPPSTAVWDNGLPGGATGPSRGASSQRSRRPGGSGRRRRATRSALPSTKAAARPRAPCRRPVAAAPHAPSATIGAAAATAPAAAAPPPDAHIPARRSRSRAPQGAHRRMPLCTSQAACRTHAGRLPAGAPASSQRRHCTRQTRAPDAHTRAGHCQAQPGLYTPATALPGAHAHSRRRDGSCGGERRQQRARNAGSNGNTACSALNLTSLEGPPRPLLRPGGRACSRSREHRRGGQRERELGARRGQQRRRGRAGPDQDGQRERMARAHRRQRGRRPEEGAQQPPPVAALLAQHALRTGARVVPETRWTVLV